MFGCLSVRSIILQNVNFVEFLLVFVISIMKNYALGCTFSQCSGTKVSTGCPRLCLYAIYPLFKKNNTKTNSFQLHENTLLFSAYNLAIFDILLKPPPNIKYNTTIYL